MEFLNKIRVALGFCDENDRLIQDDPDDGIVPQHKAYVEQPEPARNTTTIQDIEISHTDSASAEIIFQHVVRTFNASLPEFLRNSVDEEAQRRELYAGLEQGIKDYIVSLREEAEHASRKHWEKEKIRLQANLREFETRNREFEEKRNELNQRSLSNERQRRALSDKVTELEARIQDLEAEKEQYELENKSLINKVKVASVYEKENAELHSELNRLRASTSGSMSGFSEEMIKEKEDALRDAKTQLEDLEKIVCDLQAENSRLSEENSKLDEYAEQFALIESRIQQFEEIKVQKDQRIAEMKQSLAEQELANQLLHDENDKLRARMKEMQTRAEQDSDVAIQAPPRMIKEDATSIEDILSDTDWTVSTQSRRGGDSQNRRRDNKNRHNDGGNNNDSQLSLF